MARANRLCTSSFGHSESPIRLLDCAAANDAVAKPGADGSVTQAISWNVKPGAATCMVNGQAVATVDGATLAGQGITSIDGVYGIRVSHNLDVIVSGYGKK